MRFKKKTVLYFYFYSSILLFFDCVPQTAREWTNVGSKFIFLVLLIFGERQNITVQTMPVFGAFFSNKTI